MKYQNTTSEDEYFYRLNQELIEKQRVKLDADRKKQEEVAMKADHWMKCPKCGHDMEEVSYSGLMIDRCTSCSGLYFDNGELELLLKAQKPEGFLGSLKGLFEIKNT